MIAPRLVLSILLAATAACLSACGEKAPTGQVVAVVDGQEVTRRELAGEPQAANLPDGAAGQPALSAVLGGVIDRKVAVAEAERLKLDETPQFIAQAKRVHEVMLSRTLFDRWAAEIPQPSQHDLAQYMVRNPQRFAARKLFLVDRIETTFDKGQSDALTPLQTNDAIAAYLDSRSQAYRRSRAVLDSATVPAPFFRQLASLAPGYPLAIVQGGTLVAIAVVEARDAPPPQSEAEAAAVKALKQEAIQRKLAALRRTAKIAYQPGYRPEIEKGPGATSASGSASKER